MNKGHAKKESMGNHGLRFLCVTWETVLNIGPKIAIDSVSMAILGVLFYDSERVARDCEFLHSDR